MDYVGSFHGFADPTGPNAGAALDSNGSVKGTITYQATSLTNDPDPSLLPGQSPRTPHQREHPEAVRRTPRPSWAATTTLFSYQNGNYVQFGAPPNPTQGDVTGH